MRLDITELMNKLATQMLRRRGAMIREAYTTPDPVRRITLHFALGNTATACVLLNAYNKAHPDMQLPMSQFMGATN